MQQYGQYQIDNLKSFSEEHFKIGSMVKLHWTGDKVVPKYLAYGMAEVKGYTRKGNLVVAPKSMEGTLSINPIVHTWEGQKLINFEKEVTE